jgi:hypothetical protein
MLRHVALVRTDVSEEPSASFNRVTRIGELGTTLAATSNRRTRATWRKIPEDTILHSHRRENLKSYDFDAVSQLYHFPLTSVCSISHFVRIKLVVRRCYEDGISRNCFQPVPVMNN